MGLLTLLNMKGLVNLGQRQIVPRYPGFPLMPDTQFIMNKGCVITDSSSISTTKQTDTTFHYPKSLEVS